MTQRSLPLSIFNELKRRNVFKVGIAYVIVAWLIAQVLQLVFESFGTPAWAIKSVLVLLATGLPRLFSVPPAVSASSAGGVRKTTAPTRLFWACHMMVPMPIRWRPDVHPGRYHRSRGQRCTSTGHLCRQAK